MKRLVPALLAAASALVLSACAFSSPNDTLKEQADASRSLNRGIERSDPVDDMHGALLAGARGDWSVATALGEKSYLGRPTVWNEFNLATAYQNSGHAGQAIPLYANLVYRGRFVALAPIQNQDGSWPRPMAATVSEEAQARLNQLSGIGAGPRVATFNYPPLANPQYSAAKYRHQQAAEGLATMPVIPDAGKAPG